MYLKKVNLVISEINHCKFDKDKQRNLILEIFIEKNLL